MASSRKQFTVWQDEKKENLMPENAKRMKRSASVSDCLPVYKSGSTESCVHVAKKITGACGVLKEKNNNVRARPHSLTSQLKKGVKIVKFMEKGRHHGNDCKFDVESQHFRNEKCIMVANNQNENASTSNSSASTLKCGVQMNVDKRKLKFNVKLPSSKSTDNDNWRKFYHPRLLSVQQNEGTATPVELPIPPYLDKVKQQRRRNTKDVPVEVSTDELQTDANCKSTVSKPSYDPDEADEYIKMQFEREKSRRILTILRNDFIFSPQRKILVDFLMRVNTFRGDSTFILYQTMKIMDAAVKAMKTDDMEDLIVTALAAMWISIKCDNVNIPTATSMIAFGGEELKNEGEILKKFECRILKALNFDVSHPDISSILAHFIFTHYGTSNDDPRIEITYDCGNFLIDMAICDVCLCTESAILLAAVATNIALFLVENPNELLPDYFGNQFFRVLYANKFQYAEAVCVRNIMIERTFDWRNRYSTGSRTFRKFANNRYKKIKEFLLENIDKLNIH